MSSINITHTAAEGTLILGTERNDGSATPVKRAGFRWSRNLGSWYFPRSRDQKARTATIATLADALRADGHTVTVSIDDTARPIADVEADMAARSDVRTERLTARAEQHNAAADNRYDAYRAVADRIPLGQPILIGHHSEGRHRRDLARMDKHMATMAEHHNKATRAARAAVASVAATGARYNPSTIANRISGLEAQERRAIARRDCTGHYATYLPPSNAYLAQLTAELGDVEQKLTYWRRVRAEQIGTGAATNYSPDSVRPGDAVLIRGQWRTVVRANAKSVTVDSDFSWTSRVPWHEVKKVATRPEPQDG